MSRARSLAELHEERRFALRLTPDRALETVDEAEEFLLDRGLLTRTSDSALPSLFEACHEEPYAPDKPGFGQWPATKFGWFGELGERGYLILKVHRGKNVIVTDAVAALLDPVCRGELERMERASEEWALLLSHLAAAGPSTLDDLRTELGLKPKELKSIRYPLELCGAAVARSLVYATGDSHAHTAELARWDQVHPEPTAGGGLEDLVVAGVRAAVVAPEAELRRWFAWEWRWDDGLVERLVREGRLARPEPAWVYAP